MCMHTHARTYAHTHTRAHTRTHACKCTRTHTCTRTRTHVCMQTHTLNGYIRYPVIFTTYKTVTGRNHIPKSYHVCVHEHIYHKQCMLLKIQIAYLISELSIYQPRLMACKWTYTYTSGLACHVYS